MKYLDLSTADEDWRSTHEVERGIALGEFDPVAVSRYVEIVHDSRTDLKTDLDEAQKTVDKMQKALNKTADKLGRAIYELQNLKRLTPAQFRKEVEAIHEKLADAIGENGWAL